MSYLSSRLSFAVALLGAVSMSHSATPVFVIHGGAGVVKSEMTPEREKAVRAALDMAVRAGYAKLTAGGSSVDAVQTAIVILEDSPLFNAGKGAVFNHDGKNEMDASIMNGATMSAGAVANVHRIKNPIELARAVMEKSEHVMLIDEGAEKFATSIGMPLVDPKYFYTQDRWDQLQQALQQERNKTRDATKTPHHGTVGAVALDMKGNLAAGTSTGGMTNKRFGRVGDSPIIGAGTYADARCAVSATGWGEFYIRATAARDICARVEFRGDTLKSAADEVVLGVIPKMGGDGGVIALDSKGNIAMPFNTDGMFRAWVDRDGKVHVAIYPES